jgi:hypothetical protein
MDILADKCAEMRGSSPRPVNVDESLIGALLGFGADSVDVETIGTSTFGLWEKREDII